MKKKELISKLTSIGSGDDEVLFVSSDGDKFLLCGDIIFEQKERALIVITTPSVFLEKIIVEGEEYTKMSELTDKNTIDG